jgi:pyruvate,water dikinase
MGDVSHALEQLGAAAFAVRSSAIEEDAADASFAGILLSRLNITSATDVLSALSEVCNVASAPAVLNYSERMSVPQPRVAAVVQTFVPAEASGVLFMRDPQTDENHYVIEACWGLGTGVVDGLVRPDRWIVSTGGDITSSHIADKDIAVVGAPDGGTTQIAVESSCRRRACVTPESLRQLSRLAAKCEELFGTPQDIEWAIWEDRIWLLQSRPITVRAS